MSRSRIVDLDFSIFLSYFHFLFIKLRVRVGVTIGHTVTSVTSDGMVTGHKT